MIESNNTILRVKDFDNFILDKTYYLSRDGAMCPISVITWDSDNWYADYCDRDANYHTKDQIKYCIYSLEPVGEDIVLKKHFFNNFKEDIIELLITNDTIVRLSDNKLKLFIGMELEEKYFKIAKQRIGKKVKLEEEK